MATENKKYLDLAGLQKLKDDKILVKHPQNSATSAGAYKVGTDANGHVIIGSALATVASSGSYNDLSNKPTIGNGTLTIQANGNSKGTFTANQTSDKTINITAADLGLSSALSFAGTTLTALTDGATTNPIKIKQNSSDTTGVNYTAIAGNVVLYNDKEFIWTGSAWEELGDEASHALKTITISAGEGLTGGGNLSANRTISHATKTAVSAAPVKVGYDKFGHVVIGGALSTAENGAHTHTVTSTIPASSFLTSASGTTTKIGLSKNNDTFVKSYPGVTSKLVTTTITGTNGTVTASKATAGEAIAVATVGSAVVYGKADVGESKTVATRASSQTTVGNANVGSEISITGVDGSTTASKATAGTAVSVATVGESKTVATLSNGNTVIGNANVGTAVNVATSVKSATATTTAMKAAYDATTECLTFSVGAVTPTVTLNTSSITPATTSTTKISSAIGTTSVIPAKANGSITPYTFTNVTVPVASEAATVFNPAVTSTTKIYSVGGTTSVTSAVAAPSSQTIIPAVANGTITPYTFADVTAAKVADAATTIATGKIATTGTGDSLLTGLGTATTASALTGASIASGSTGDVTVVTGVSSAKNSDAVSISGSAASAGAHKHNVE